MLPDDGSTPTPCCRLNLRLRPSLSMSTTSSTPDFLRVRFLNASLRPPPCDPPVSTHNSTPSPQVKKLSENAVLPVRGSEWAAGYDLAR
jgi:hypothetical protein